MIFDSYQNMRKFEYKIIAPDLGEDIDPPHNEFINELSAKHLNTLGDQGWELVSAIPSKLLGDKTGYLGVDPLADIVFVFKREIAS